MRQRILFYSILTMLLVLMQFSFVFADNISTSKSVGTPKGVLEVSATGAATYTIPISCPKGYGKMTPNLSLVYNSQSGYGYVGYGCNVSGLSVITRGCKDIYHDGTASGVKYANDDAYFLDGKRLIYQSGTKGQEGAVYVVEGDPFTKVLFHGTSYTTWIEVTTNDGMTYYYGNGNDARLSFSKAGSTYSHTWYLSKTFDSQGRFINYIYAKSNLQIYLCLVVYGMSGGSVNQIHLSYENIKNPNTQLSNVGGVKGCVDVRLKQITTEGNSGQIYRKYECVYDSLADASKVRYSRLVKVNVSNGNGEYLNPIALNWKGLSGTSQNVTLPQIDIEAKSPLQEIVNKSFMSRDLNGDGVDDVIKVAVVKDFTSSNSYNSNLHAYLFLSERLADGSVKYNFKNDYTLCAAGGVDDAHKILPSGNTIADIDGDGFPDALLTLQMQYGKVTQYFICAIMGNTLTLRKCSYYMTSPETPMLATADVNHDGKDEIFYLTKANNNGNYTFGYMTNSDINILDLKEYSLPLPKEPRRFFMGDYNNDGMPDALVVYDGGYKIFFNNGSRDISKIFTNANSLTGTSLADKWRMEQGDFNGDGLSDFVYTEKSGDISLALNNGDGTFDVKYAIKLDMVDKNTGKDDNRFCLLPYDMDGDGKTDLLVTKTDYKYHGGFHNHYSFRNTQTAWLRSLGNTLTLDKKVFTDNENDAQSGNLLVGDFAGIGVASLMNYGKNIYEANTADAVQMRLYSNANSTVASGKVVKITDGLGGVSTIDYSVTSNPNVKLEKNKKLSFPVAEVSVSIPVVKKIISHGVTVSYLYGGLKAHTQGKGLLGFDHTKIVNETSGETAETMIGDWNLSGYVPTKTTTITTLGGYRSTVVACNDVAQTHNTYFSYPSRQVSTDYDGNITTSTFEYDTNHGYLTSQKTTFGSEDMYKKVTYQDYVQKGGAYLPTKIVNIQKHEDASEEYVQKTSYEYDDYGQIIKSFTNAETPMVFITTNAYDKFGNIVSSYHNGNGVVPVTQLYSYDQTGRYLVKAWQKPDAAITEYTHDLWGNVLTATDVTNSNSALMTTYTYNGWGDLIKTVSPTGAVETNNVIWGSSPNERYCVVKAGDGMPTEKTWYNYKGQEVRSEYPALLGVTHRKMTTYNNLNQVTSVKEGEGSQTSTENYRYDVRGRLVEDILKEKNLHTSYAYDNRTITTTIGDKIYVKTTDAWGNVKNATDPLTSVSYVYNSMGKPVEVSTCGSTVRMDYDAAGNRISLTDPDAGTMTYVYGANGKLLRQTDARGIVTNYNFDNWGRVKSCQVGTRITSYEYGNQDNETQKLVKASCDGKYEEYAYDKYGRMIKKVRNAYSNENFTTEYSYNAKNQLTQVVYPGGLSVSYSYDQNGYQRGVYSKDLVLDSLMSYNGLVAEHQLPYGMTFRRVLDEKSDLKGLFVKKGETNVFGMDLEYDSLTGNLLSRTGMLPQKEMFEYDNLDRLVSSKSTNGESINISYAANGNILSKTNVGNYVYGVKPHAVMSIDNIDAYSANQELDTKFNEMGKIDSVEINANPMATLAFTYGPDNQLWNMDYIPKGPRDVNLGNRFWSRYYDEEYEKFVSANNNLSFYYLTNNVIATRENDGNYKFYIVAKDNLGSIVNVFDKNANKVFSASYDAWGKQTVTLATDEMSFLLRGYCGHEMLTECGLINMKGRLYDPILGRFLSPDNYVQMPDNSQSFNRYSYCLDNPLKYTDPSGEFWNLIIGGVIGGVFDWASHGFQFNLKGLGYFFVGSIAGSVTAGMASGMNVALAGGNFWAGAAGFTNGISSTGFFAGALAGSCAGLAGGLLSGFGNSLVAGHNIGNSLVNGLASGGISAIEDGLVGGLLGGVDALDKGSNFWSGRAKLDLNGAYSCSACMTSDFIMGESTITGKYVGQYEGVNVFETKKFGSLITPESDGLLHFRAATIPERGILAGEGVYTSQKILGKQMMQHEFGHILQYREYGSAAYWHIIAPESLLNATFSPSTHSSFWTETWANYMSKNYFGKLWIGGLDYPCKNISTFNLFRVQMAQMQGLMMTKPRGFFFDFVCYEF